ncbi:ParB/RepB/Spo0J family partition protein [soil metagenome]
MAGAGAVERDVTRRSGLGRGLDALLPPGETVVDDSSLRTVPLDAIEPNPRQPRKSFAGEEIAELAASVRRLGLLQPLLVRIVSPGVYELIAGERRMRAARLAELEEVPVVVVETDAQGSLERALVENLHRSDLNPLEEAHAYRELLNEHSLTQEQVAERIGRSRVTVTNALRLLDLPEDVQRLLIERRLSAGHGKALLGLEGNPFQSRLARRVAEEGLSVRETEELVRRYGQISGGGSTPGSRQGSGRPAAAVEAQRRLADHLGTRVRVEMGKRKGKMVVDFVSLEELERITGAICGEAPASSNRTSPGL